MQGNFFFFPVQDGEKKGLCVCVCVMYLWHPCAHPGLGAQNKLTRSGDCMHPAFGQKVLQKVTLVPGLPREENRQVAAHAARLSVLGFPPRAARCPLPGASPTAGSGGRITRPSIAAGWHSAAAPRGCQQIRAFVPSRSPPCLPLMAPFCARGT